MNLIQTITFILLGFVILMRMPSSDSFNITALALQRQIIPPSINPFVRCDDFFKGHPILPWPFPYDSIGPEVENSVPSTALPASPPPRQDSTAINGSRIYSELDLEMPCQADKSKGDKECKKKYGWTYVCRDYGALYGQSDRWYCDCGCYRYEHQDVMIEKTCSCPLPDPAKPDRRYQSRVKEGKDQFECKLREGEICILQLEVPTSKHNPQCSTGPPFWPVRLKCHPLKLPNGVQSKYGFCIRSSSHWNRGESIVVFSMLCISLCIVFNQFGIL